MKETFAAVARKHHCYLVAPAFLKESGPEKGYSNAAILFGRRGEVVGAYRKVHLVPSDDGRRFEGGARPGTMCLCLIAISASSESRSVTTWSSTTVGTNWLVKAPSLSPGRHNPRRPASPPSARCRTAATFLEHLAK